MRIPIESWKLLDWQGPTTNVRFRISADDSFLAREDDDTGVEIDAHPKVFREVDCVVATEVIDGLPVKTITIPALWLYSTTDAIVNRTVRYSAKFVTKSGTDIKPLELLQSFMLPALIIEVFNPVPWKEIIRANFPAAPVPIDRTTFSVEQILELIGQGAINGGPNAAGKRIAVWSGPVTVDGAVGFEWQNNDPTVSLISQNAAWNTFRIAESGLAANVKVGGSPALFSTHLTDQTGIWSRSIVNDAATRRWAELVRDGALGLQYSAYDNSNVLQSNTIFDPSGGIGFSDGTNPDFGYLYKASSAYHLGINAAGAGAPAATREITFTTSGVGINKPTAIGSQLHVVSGASARIGFIIDSAASPSQPLAILRNNTSQRFSFNHDAVAEFGLQSVVKGRLTFAVANNTNKTSIEAADTPASSVIYKFPAADPSNGQLLRTVTFSGGIATLEWVNPTAGGDVSSSIGTTVDNRIARFDGTTGKLIQDGAVVIADTSGSFTVPNAWAVASAGGAAITVNSATLAFTVPGGMSQTVNAGSMAWSAPTGNGAGPIYGFTTAAQTQSSGVVEIAKLITTYNQTSTAGSTDISIARTHTAIGSGEHNFIKGFVGGVASFRINSVGNYYFGFTNSHIGDANGNELVRFDHVASAISEFRVTNAASTNRPKFECTSDNTNQGFEIAAKGTGDVMFSSNILISKDSPAITLTDTVSGSGTDFAINFNGGATNVGRSGQADLQLANATGVYTFGSIPVLPASNPTTANQAARKQYVDDTSVGISVTLITDQDPNTAPGVTESGRFSWFAPDGNGMTITKLKIKFQEGSHTSGGTLTYTCRVRNSAGGAGDIGSVTLDNTNNTIHNVYTSDISDAGLAAGDSVTFYRSTLSGTVSERSVSVAFIGTQKRI